MTGTPGAAAAVRGASPRAPAGTASSSNGSERASADLEDRKLVTAYLRDRGEEAFRALYRRHTPAVLGFVSRLVGGRSAEAEDIVQTAWIRAAARLDRFRWDSSLRTWLTGIALNCHRESVRSERRAVSVGLPEFPAAAPVHLEIPRIDLERAIAQLPDGYREVLILHDVEGYTHEEIGNLMGIHNGTSKSQLSRARRAVRRWLARSEEMR
jgi:RNA polymerase sigma-70 factor (ECF subfamily)